MDDTQLDRTLRSVGKECFVKYFRQFSDRSLSGEAMARLLVEREGYQSVSANGFRVRGARRIMEAGRAKDALLIVSDSPRVPQHIRDKAASLAACL